MNDSIAHWSSINQAAAEFHELSANALLSWLNFAIELVPVNGAEGNSESTPALPVEGILAETPPEIAAPAVAQATRALENSSFTLIDLASEYRFSIEELHSPTPRGRINTANVGSTESQSQNVVLGLFSRLFESSVITVVASDPLATVASTAGTAFAIPLLTTPPPVAKQLTSKAVRELLEFLDPAVARWFKNQGGIISIEEITFWKYRWFWFRTTWGQ